MKLNSLKKKVSHFYRVENWLRISASDSSYGSRPLWKWLHINTGDVQNDVLGRRFLPKFRACGIWSRALLIHIYPSAGTAVEWNVDSILVWKARDEGKERGRGREGMEKWGMGRKGDGYEGIGKGKGKDGGQ